MNVLKKFKSYTQNLTGNYWVEGAKNQKNHIIMAMTDKLLAQLKNRGEIEKKRTFKELTMSYQKN
jgi:hypothetical protein